MNCWAEAVAAGPVLEDTIPLMKRIYWRPKGISRTALVLVAAISLGGMALVERFRVRSEQPYFEEKMAAARLALTAMQKIQQVRESREPAINPLEDPARSGLIGVEMTPVTSDPGSLAAKQTSVNPNFAALIVHWLREAGVGRGDVVAVGASGSFPALNICVYAALQTLETRPVVISSASASQWGANLPDFLWLDMERVLVEAGVFHFRSVAASLGGVEDRGVGMATEGRELLEEGIRRNGVPLIAVGSLAESVEQRMQLYREHAGGAPIRAYINIGGGTSSVGTSVGKRLFEPGLNLPSPSGVETIESVMSRLSRADVPVIHLVQIEELARTYGLPLRPQEIPPVGQAGVFYQLRYNPWLAAGVLLAILASLYAFIHTEVGYRMMQTPGGVKEPVTQEPMI